MRHLTAFIAGLIFGIGLIVSGMAQPAKVLAFLDLAGAWDSSLALVMIGAVVTDMGAFALARERQRSVLGLPMHLPTARTIDKRLVGGALIFGVGWGLAGLCPGPALVDLGTGQAKVAIFVLALLARMGCFDAVQRLVARRDRPRESRMRV